MTVSLTLIGGPTALITIDGLTVLTDPTFDAPGEYPIPGGVLVKTSGPVTAIADLPDIDLVTVSHAHHPDNLDASGADLVSSVRMAVGTSMAHEQIANIRALDAWQRATVTSDSGVEYTVTAVPARHGPEGCEEITGIVTGFVIAADGHPTVYISGDNAAVELVAAIAERFPRIDVAVLFTGAARVGLFDNAPLTLTADMAVEAATLLGSAMIFPVHSEGWAHFSEDRAELASAFAKAGLADRLLLAQPGEVVTI